MQFVDDDDPDGNARAATPEERRQKERERRFGRAPVELPPPQPIPQLRVSDFDACMEAQDRGEEYERPAKPQQPVRSLRASEMAAALAARDRGEEYVRPEEDGVWYDAQAPDGVIVRMFVRREKSNDEQFEEDVALNMQRGMTRLGAELYARAWAVGAGRMPRIERPKMEPPQEPRTAAEAEAWAKYESVMNCGTQRTYTRAEADQLSADTAAAFEAYNLERARTDANGATVEGDELEARVFDIQLENEALKDAALTLPDDPRRAARIARYEAIMRANMSYISTQVCDRASECTEVAVNCERERAATAVVRRVMRSIWRTAPPPPKPPPRATHCAQASNAHLGLAAVDHAYREAA